MATHQLIMGLKVCVQPDSHRTLPAEVCPGVPWPPGFKAEIDAWMKGFFRPISMLKDGEVWHDRISDTLHMNPRTWEHVKVGLGQMKKGTP